MISNLKPIAVSLAIIASLAYQNAYAAKVPMKSEIKATPAPLLSSQPSSLTVDPFGPVPSPHDSSNVSFPYEPTKMYNLFTQAGQFLQLVLSTDEEIVTVQSSDRIRWQVSRVEEGDVAPRLFIKPSVTGLVTTISVVTAVKGVQGISERTYDLRLESSPEGGKRYQRVNFTYPQVDVIKRAQNRRVEEAASREEQRIKDTELSPGLAVEKLNWKYSITGTASFRPIAVFDDGRFMYLSMPTTEEWPAVFAGDRRDAVMVKTARRGDYLVVQRLVDKLLLKIDDKEIQITKSEKSSWFGGSR